jgi:hypothetical protein
MVLRECGQTSTDGEQCEGRLGLGGTLLLLPGRLLAASGFSRYGFAVTLRPIMDERDFYTEKQELKKANYSCPKCRQMSEFQIRWLRRSKKRDLPRGASDYDRAKFAKARDYLVRVDDMLFCPNPRCRNRFEIPNSQTVVFI